MSVVNEGWKKSPQSRQEMIQTNQRLNRRCQKLEQDLAIMTLAFVKYASVAKKNNACSQMILSELKELRRAERAAVSAGSYAKFGWFKRLVWRLLFRESV